jgi:hypothetical protein
MVDPQRLAGGGIRLAALPNGYWPEGQLGLSSFLISTGSPILMVAPKRL